MEFALHTIYFLLSIFDLMNHPRVTTCGKQKTELPIPNHYFLESLSPKRKPSEEKADSDSFGR